jgi:hypothetical protein
VSEGLEEPRLERLQLAGGLAGRHVASLYCHSLICQHNGASEIGEVT